MEEKQTYPLINVEADTHTHSAFSFDADNNARDMAEAAVKAGLKTLALTEHLDLNEYKDPRFKDRKKLIERAAAEIPLLKRDFEGRLNLLFGVELGQSVWDLKLAGGLLNSFRDGLDFVLGSVHAVRGWEDFYYLDYSKFDYYELLEKYFGEILETVEWGKIHSIAHLTYPIRYISGRQGLECDISRFDGIIEKIFLAAAKNNIALEINTGGLRNESYGRLDPEQKYIKMFRELGGKYVTIGSDAHRCSDIGKGLEVAAAAAKEAGFNALTVFVGGKPTEQEFIINDIKDKQN